MPPDVGTFELAAVLTAAGATVAATLIASIIEVAKRVPAIGGWIDAGHEPGIAILLSLGLVAYAFAATATVVDLVTLFGAFLAFIGIAKLSTAAYDTGASIKARLSE